jgi:hypothetical protein
MAMILGRFSQLADELREALLELSHKSLPGHQDEAMIRIHWGAEQLYRAAAEIEPDAHFSTLCRAVKELALEAAELGLLDSVGGARASHRMAGFGLKVHPKPDGSQGARQVIFLRDSLPHIDRWKRSAKMKRERER